jgi:hypothetical protein
MLLSSTPLFAQSSSAKYNLVNEAWPATWIDSSDAAPSTMEVYHFRKTFTLDHAPEHFVVHVSGDRRYRFFVNGVSLGVGPQRSDAFKWRYETYDLGKHLHAGQNVVSAVVWNYTEDAPYALISVKTGLLVEGDSPAEAAVNTDASWKVEIDHASTALAIDRAALHTFLVTGPGQKIDGRHFDWDWMKTDFDDHAWSPARASEHGMPDGVGTDVTHWLVPRNIPLPEEKNQRLGRVRRAEGGIDMPTADFLAGHAPLQIPAHSEITLLCDQNFETNAFPHLVMTGGRDSSVRLTYAEALFDSSDKKGNRDQIDGKHIVGVTDEFIADGGEHRDFSPLLFRTYRYLQLHIRTADTPLTIEDLYGVATGYPFIETGSFQSDDSSLSQLWNVGWRTARLCAYETYTDCPYYEQLQYVGDTRIQALITLYVSGDDRLMRNAIELFDNSRRPMGLTQSRYPTTTPQIIPTFSLFWIQMVHDYWMNRRDDAFVNARLLGVSNVLSWFEDRIDKQTGMLGYVPYWNFVDWCDEWKWVDSAHPGGEPPGATDGGSSVVSLQLAWTLEDAADLFAAGGQKEKAEHYRAVAQRLRESTLAHCWDAQRSLIADTPAKTTFSQHADVFAVLSGAIKGAKARELMRRVDTDRSLTHATIYFDFYVLKAMKAAGLGDEYIEHLKPWRDMIANGLTTFAEKPDPTRSDCHAWSASPNYDLLATVCGVEPASAGFATVKIEPHLGPLHDVTGVVPHPDGVIRVKIHRDGAASFADVELPQNVTGEFVWAGHSTALHGGNQHLALQDR